MASLTALDAPPPATPAVNGVSRHIARITVAVTKLHELLEGAVVEKIFRVHNHLAFNAKSPVSPSKRWAFSLSVNCFQFAWGTCRTFQLLDLSTDHSAHCLDAVALVRISPINHLQLLD